MRHEGGFHATGAPLLYYNKTVMRNTGRAFQLKLCCPRCGAAAREDGFVGHTYFCHCGWSIKKKDTEKGGSLLSLTLFGLAFIASGVWLYLEKLQ